MRFALNDGVVETEIHPGIPALDFLREHAGLSGVKFACREGDCGSCVILLGRPGAASNTYRVVTSCLLPVGALHGHHVVTVEGLNRDRHGPVQSAFVTEGASQCGFCTPGFVVALTGHLLEAQRWNLDDAVEAVAGNICRCTGYASIQRSLASVIDHLQSTIDVAEERVPALVREGFLPAYFLEASDLMAGLELPPAVSMAQPSSVLVAGGTDLFVQRADELMDMDVQIVPIETETPVWREKNHIYLAATATAEDMKRSRLLEEAVAGIEAAMRLMGSLPIRQRATLAGNIVNASPIGDMTIILLALGSELGLTTGKKRRSLELSRFFLAYKELDLRPGELIEWIRFANPGKGHAFNFEKVSKRTHLDIASVNSAASISVRNGKIVTASISAGGVAPIPTLLPRTAEYLSGRTADAVTAAGAAEVARSEVAPIDDVRGSADYKRLLLGQLVLAHFHELFGIEEGLLEEARA